MTDLHPPSSTPIHDALAVLREHGALKAADADALVQGLPSLPAVRALGDLQETIRTKDLLNMEGMTEALYKRVKRITDRR
jgi:hypothetical protein